jgi:hypothetical protein
VAVTNSTDEYWAVDGVSLQTYAYNISSWGGDRQAPPPLRGDNFVLPQAPGATWYPKVPDSRTMSLGMWVEGCNPDGSVPEFGDRRRLFEDNWSMLRQRLWNPYRQFSLTKKIRIPGTDQVIPVTAKAQFAGGLAPQMFGTHMAQFTVDIFLADPFFYSAPIDVPMNQDFTVIGDARTHNIGIYLPHGVKVTNNQGDSTGSNDIWVQNIDDDANLTIDVRKFTAFNAQGAPRTGYVRHSGSSFWMALDPGETHVAATAVQHASGSSDAPATMTYQAAWF